MSPFFVLIHCFFADIINLLYDKRHSIQVLLRCIRICQKYVMNWISPFVHKAIGLLVVIEVMWNGRSYEYMDRLLVENCAGDISFVNGWDIVKANCSIKFFMNTFSKLPISIVILMNHFQNFKYMKVCSKFLGKKWG